MPPRYFLFRLHFNDVIHCEALTRSSEAASALHSEGCARVYSAEIASVKNALLCAFLHYTEDPDREERVSESCNTASTDRESSGESQSRRYFFSLITESLFATSSYE